MGRTVVSKQDVLRTEIERSASDNIKFASSKTNIEKLTPELINNIKRLIADNKELEKTKRLTEQDAFEVKEDTSTKSIPIQADRYMSRLLKYIPAEVIALYLTLDAVIRSSSTLPIGIHWAVFIFGIVGTYLYLSRIEKVDKRIQLLISVGAYCVWVFTLGGPFVHIDWYEPAYGALILPVYTFLIPIIEV